MARENFEPVDLFHAHIGGMDAFARGLKVAAAIRRDGVLDDFIKQRYASWDSPLGADIEAGRVGFADLGALADNYGASESPPPAGGTVPEPASPVLLALGGLALLRRKRR